MSVTGSHCTLREPLAVALCDNDEVDSLSAIVPDTLRQLLRRGPLTQEKLTFAWRAAVGPALGRVTDARLVPPDVVEVRVPDPSWRREIEAAQPLIFSKLKELLGPAVSRMRVTGPGDAA